MHSDNRQEKELERAKAQAEASLQHAYPATTSRSASIVAKLGTLRGIARKDGEIPSNDPALDAAK